MNSLCPQLRPDLHISRQHTPEGTILVIKDPLSGQYFRLRELEQFIAEQLNGKTAIEAVRRKAEVRFEATLPAEALNAFIDKLEKAGLLERGGGTAESKRHRKKNRIQGNVLYLRYNVLDPAPLFNRLIHHVRFFFTPSFVALSGFLILFAAAVLAEHWNEFTGDVPRVFQLSSIPLFLLTFFFVISAHEFAHGLTCKHFGGDVHEMGILLLYFQPALYCNVSDAWLFPEKSKRLWVGFAGPYFELFVWALAVLAWRVASQDTWVSHAALLVMAGSGVKTFFNFNPFIKLDGYYLLSDYLEIPNLRRKAFRHVGILLKRLFGIEISSTDDLPRREQRVFLVYGLVAGLGLFVLMFFVFMTAGEYLLQGNMVAMFILGLVGVRIRKRFRRLFGGNSYFPDGLDEDDDFPPQKKVDGHPPSEDAPGREIVQSSATMKYPGSATSVLSAQEDVINKIPTSDIQKDVQDRKVPEGQKEARKRARQKDLKNASLRTRRGFWAVVAVGVLLALFLIPMELRITGPFTILPIHNADVRAEIEGIIKEIYVTEGDLVEENGLLARLSGSELRTELSKTAAQIRQSRARLRMQQAGPTEEEIGVARAAVEKAGARLSFAQTRLERDKLQVAMDLISKKEFENTQELAVAAENDLADARSRLAVLLKGTRPEEIDATKAEIAQLEAQRTYLQLQLQRLEVRSPVAGTVATPARQLQELVGKMVQKGALIAKVFDLEKLTVEIPIPEKEIADVRVGQQVAFKAKAYPNETFTGRVISIATAVQSRSVLAETSSPIPAFPASGNTENTVLVTTQVDNGSLVLKPGMTGQAKISCGERRIIDLLARRIARTVKVEFWSWW